MPPSSSRTPVKRFFRAIRDAYHAGVVTVPYRVFPGGKAGTDYNYYISTQFQQAGALWGKWLDTALHCKGNVVNLGGPPANSQSLAEYQGLKQAIASCPGIHIIGQTPYYVTNWDPAQTQKVVTAVLAKYPKIDAITTDFGAALASAFSAFSQANRKIPAIATEDSNQLSCDQKKLGFPLFTVDSQNWMVRTAVDFAVAKATGGHDPGLDGRSAEGVRGFAHRQAASGGVRLVSARRRDPVVASDPRAAQGGVGRVAHQPHTAPAAADPHSRRPAPNRHTTA